MIKRLKAEASVQSTCATCRGRVFDAKLLYVHNLKYKPTVIQCSKCGGVIGIVEPTR